MKMLMAVVMMMMVFLVMRSILTRAPWHTQHLHQPHQFTGLWCYISTHLSCLSLTDITGEPKENSSTSFFRTSSQIHTVDRQTDGRDRWGRQIGRQADRWKLRHRVRPTDRKTYSRGRDGRTDRWQMGQAGRQAGRQMEYVDGKT